MRLNHPSGWWAVAGLAILIAVYLFRPKYEDHGVPSTYLWKLSEQFRRKQRTFQRFKKIILFFLQLLMVLLGILLVVQPLFAFQGSSVDYVAILDTSASMRLRDAQGKSRFEKAQEALLQDAKNLPFGSAMTVIPSGNPEIALTERTRNYSELEIAVDRADCGWGDSDLSEAMNRVQAFLWEHPMAQVYLYTDLEYPANENMHVVSIPAAGEWNVALSGLKARKDASGTVEWTHQAISYGQDAQITLGLYVDGKLKSAQKVLLRADEPQEIVWVEKGIFVLSNTRVFAQADDAFQQDNECWLVEEPARSNQVLLISEAPFYWEKILSVFSSLQVTVLSELPSSEALKGYDLYIFDRKAVSYIPEDGSVWIVNPMFMPSETNILLGRMSYGGSVTAARNVTPACQVLLENLFLQDVKLRRLMEVRLTGQLEPILMCGEVPALLAGRSNSGLQEIMIMFDLHDSNLPLLSDFVFLVKNMLDYSLPGMIDKWIVDVGEEIQLNILPMCQQAYLQSPDGSISTITHDGKQAVLKMDEPGLYTVIQKRADGSSKYVDFYLQVPIEESNPSFQQSETYVDLEVPELIIEEEKRQEEENLFQPMPYLAGLLLLLMVIEWVVFNREQY